MLEYMKLFFFVENSKKCDIIGYVYKKAHRLICGKRKGHQVGWSYICFANKIKQSFFVQDT